MNKDLVKKQHLKENIVTKKHHNAFDVIKGTLLTEKTTELELNKSIICFTVPVWANKEIIKAAVEAIFDVKVFKVNVLNNHGKRKTFQGKQYFKSPVKKAMVKVDSTKKIGGFVNAS